MIKLAHNKLNEMDVRTFEKWVVREWGNVEPKVESLNHNAMPNPILAYEGIELVGGIKFTYYKNPSSEDKALWINALYVENSYRRKGIAQLLIEEAVLVAIKTSFTELFVYTDKPKLYSKLGWQVMTEKDNQFVLRFDLKDMSKLRGG